MKKVVNVKKGRKVALAVLLTIIPILTDILLPGIGVADDFLLIPALLLLVQAARTGKPQARKRG